MYEQPVSNGSHTTKPEASNRGNNVDEHTYKPPPIVSRLLDILKDCCDSFYQELCNVSILPSSYPKLPVSVLRVLIKPCLSFSSIRLSGLTRTGGKSNLQRSKRPLVRVVVVYYCRTFKRGRGEGERFKY